MSAWSVSQRLLPNLSEGITWCLPGSTQYLSCLCLSDGFDQCLSELVLTVPFLPMSVRRNLLMSIWTELACFLASIFLVSSIGVCLECFPTFFAKSVWRDHLMSSWINPISFLSVSVWWVWSIIVWTGSHRFCLPMSAMKNLLMSLWTELACFPASIF